MRFLVKLRPVEGRAITVRLDYRSRFISLMKTIFGEDFFQRNGARPYTFAVYFGKSARIRGNSIEGVELVNLRFSTGDSSLAVKFYNGVLKLKKVGYTHRIGEGNFRVEWIREERERRITGAFKTLSPVVVERIGFGNSRDVEERYRVPGEEGFELSFLENVTRRYESILGKRLEVKHVSIVSLGIKKEFVKHYGGVIKCFVGRFRVETESEELLNFIYKYGAGLRTGQGFGFLEVEDEKS